MMKSWNMRWDRQVERTGKIVLRGIEQVGWEISEKSLFGKPKHMLDDIIEKDVSEINLTFVSPCIIIRFK